MYVVHVCFISIYIVSREGALVIRSQWWISNAMQAIPIPMGVCILDGSTMGGESDFEDGGGLAQAIPISLAAPILHATRILHAKDGFEYDAIETELIRRCIEMGLSSTQTFDMYRLEFGELRSFQAVVVDCCFVTYTCVD